MGSSQLRFTPSTPSAAMPHGASAAAQAVSPQMVPVGATCLCAARLAAAEAEGVPKLYRNRLEHNTADTIAPSGSCADKGVSAAGGPPDSLMMTTTGVQTRFLATTAVQTSSLTTAG